MNYNFSYIYPEMDSITRKEADVHRLLDKDLSYQEFDDAFVLPSKDLWKNGKCYGGVVTKGGDFVESSAWHEGQRCDKYDFVESDAVVRKEVAVYMGFYFACWGHSITDNLKKLWFLNSDLYEKLGYENVRFIYLSVDNKPMPAYVKRLFELAGVNIDTFELITDLSKFDKVIVPDNSFIADNGQRYFTAQFKNLINRMKGNCLKNDDIYPEKVYFTRTQLKGQRDIGEESIERIFKKNGYTVFAPEKIPVDMQIQLMCHCKAFAATEGSISHNVLFCNPGVEVAVIRKCNDVNKYQMACNEIADANVTYLDVHRSTKVPKEAPWAGPFYLYVNKNAARFFGYGVSFPHYLHHDWYLYMWNGSSMQKFCSRAINKVKRVLKF